MFAVIPAVFLVFLLLVFENTIAVPISHLLCHDNTRFYCYTVKKGDDWKTLFPNQEKRDLVMRLNRINISLYKGMKIVIPKNLETATSFDYAPLPKNISPPGEKIIYVSINPQILAWGAYNADGVLQAWGPVSGGKGWCPDLNRGCHTAIGKFAVYQKMGAGCVSSKFPVGRGGAPMPYCMFFHGGFALHGSYEVPGYNASHGCVRLFIPDAKWLNLEFVGDDNVPVIITNQT
ncbi:MAG TPA: L,D-transpeptidase [Gammaproteobacteria bacterium]|nr:L,D-transpeptidase [Gammaproteobacteria bacterium]